MLDKDFHVKLCDFGEAKIIRNINSSKLQEEFAEFQQKQAAKKKKKKPTEEDKEDDLELEVEEVEAMDFDDEEEAGVQ